MPELFEMNDREKYGYYDESVTTWIVIPAGITDEEIGERMPTNPYGTYCQHEYDCCANWYSQPIRIKRQGQRVLVTQDHYRNV